MVMHKIENMYELFGKSEGLKCKDCEHLITHEYSRRYYKCEVYGNSASVATDWAINKTACGLFNKPYAGDLPIVGTISRKTIETQIEGQIGLFDGTD